MFTVVAHLWNREGLLGLLTNFLVDRLEQLAGQRFGLDTGRQTDQLKEQQKDRLEEKVRDKLLDLLGGGDE